MARTSRRTYALALLALLAAPGVHAQLTNLPNLSTATSATGRSTSQQSSQSTSAASSSSRTSTSASSSQSTTQSTGASTTGLQTTATFPAATTTTPFVGLTGLPTIAGASIPSLVIPYTANAPFMQKSKLPEGTVFIIVGAILGFLGACVLAWRCLTAWSIDRSVKRAALASIRGSEKNSTWGGSGVNSNHYSSMKSSMKGGYYSEYAAGSSMSLDALNSAGKQLNKPLHRDSESHSRHASAMPPAGLFFSPTAQAGRNSLAVDTMNRSSTYLPAGFYASPSAAQPAGGAGSTTVGGSLAPYARQSIASPSPPGTSHGPNSSRSVGSYARDGSRDGLRDSSAGRPGSYAPNTMYNHPSSSSLMVGVGAQGGDGSGGARAPSAYLDDLFENHGHGPRERF